MPLRVEQLVNGRWQWVGVRQPKDRAVSISSLDAEGKRQLYVFKCAPDDGYSVIYRSRGGVDTDPRHLDARDFVVLVTLKPGEEYILTVTPENKPERQVRFTQLHE